MDNVQNCDSYSLRWVINVTAIYEIWRVFNETQEYI
jgi:hypothetical protein